MRWNLSKAHRGCYRKNFIETTYRVAIPELLNELHPGENELKIDQSIVISSHCG